MAQQVVESKKQDKLEASSLADLSKIASEISIKDNKITFTLDKGVNLFGIRYEGNNFSAQQKTSNELVRRDENGQIYTLKSSKNEGRYEYNITKVEEGKSKLDLTLDKQLTKAYLDIGDNKTIVVNLKNGSIVAPAANTKPLETKPVETYPTEGSTITAPTLNGATSNSQATGPQLPQAAQTNIPNPNQASSSAASLTNDSNSKIAQTIDPQNLKVLYDSAGNLIQHVTNNLPNINNLISNNSIPQIGELRAINGLDTADNKDLAELTLPSLADLGKEKKDKHEVNDPTGAANGARTYAAATLNSRRLPDFNEAISPFKEQLDKFNKIDVSKITDAKTLNSTIKEISTTSKDLDKALSNNIKKLEKNLNSLELGSKEFELAKSQLAEYKNLKADLSIKKHEIAASSVLTGNEDLSKAARKSSISMRNEVSKAYDSKISIETDVDKKANLINSKNALKNATNEFIDEVGNPLNKTSKGISDYFKANPDVAKKVEYVSDKISKITKPYASTKEFFTQRSEARFLKQANEIYKNSNTTIDANADTQQSKVPDRKSLEKLEKKIDSRIDDLKRKLEIGDNQELRKRLSKMETSKEMVATEKVKHYPETELTTKSQNNEFKSISKKVAALEKSVLSDPNSEILKSELELAKTRKDLLLEKNKLEILEKTKATTPKELFESRNKITELLNKEVSNLTDQYYILEKKINSTGISEAEKNNLIKQKAVAERSYIEVEKQLKTLEPDSNIRNSSNRIKELYDDLKQSKKSLDTETDPVKKVELENKIAKLEAGKDLHERNKINIEIEESKKQINTINKEIDGIKQDLEANKNLKSNKYDVEVEIKQGELAKLNQNLKANEFTLKYLEEKNAIIDDRINHRSEVEKLKEFKSKIESTTDVQKRIKLQAEYDIEFAKVSELGEKVAKAQNTFDVKTKAMLTKGIKVLNSTLPGSEWAKKNPIKAASIMGMLSEAGFAVTAADYSPDAKHSLVPSLVSLLNNDIRDWASLTTEQATTPGAMAIEATSAAANVVIAVSAFKGGEALATKLGIAQRITGIFAGIGAQRATVGTLAFADGYFRFSGGQVKDFTDSQLASNTASPIVSGAVGGAVIGSAVPVVGTIIGAGIGGTAGAVGDLVGNTVGLAKLDAEAKADVKKSAVIESLRQAEMGFVYADGTAPSRGALSTEEHYVLDEKAKIRALSLIFSGEKIKQAEATALGFERKEDILFTEQDIKDLGLNTIAEIKAAKSPEEESKMQQQNWERLSALQNGKGWFINPLDELKIKSEPEIHKNYTMEQRLKMTHEEKMMNLGNKLENLFKISKREYVKIYDSAMRHEYTLEAPVSGFGVWLGYDSSNMGIIHAKKEFVTKAQTMATSFPVVETDEQKQMAEIALRSNFPMLDSILENFEARNQLINNLGEDKGIGKYLKEEYESLINKISSLPEGLVALE